MADHAPADDTQVLGVTSAATLTEPPANLGDAHYAPVAAGKKSRAFYLSFLAICTTTFLSAIDLTAVATALPTIAHALNDTKGEFTWVGTAYALASTTFILLGGSLADAFGRRPVVLLSISLFAIGSALSGASQNMNMLVAARTVQGMGGGGILSLTEILIGDLVPLAERGVYQGMVGLTWAFAASIGPPIGGALANVNDKAWRWLFFLNLPICGLAMLLVFFFLRVRTPPGTISEKLGRVDWIGNFLVICGAGLAIVGLAWAGIRYPWNSAQTLAPLIIGFVILFFFGVYEYYVPKYPAIPLDVIGNRTSLGGLLVTAVHGMASISTVYYLPVYFQAALGASPIRSAVESLSQAAFISPAAMMGGTSVRIFGKYKPPTFVAWCVVLIGFGLFTTFDAHTPTRNWVGFQIVIALGMGALYPLPTFPILAPLDPRRSGSALALFVFTRSFFQSWGITISSTILQNKLEKNLPQAFVDQFPKGFEIAYLAIPEIRAMPASDPLKGEIQAAFATSLKAVWQTWLGICGIGLFATLLMKEIPLHRVGDATYALEEKKKAEAVADGEKGDVAE
ncbi:MFS domain-containing protein [Mycena chlorophos]|uniref:MFS domain-containing protein n=1 Tax=Mycena chlorophos TaxID=658473 RepID=A0A8H6T7Q9_MYCCL|nr:MFS domain-containing protein [Mycena chlorophos]